MKIEAGRKIMRALNVPGTISIFAAEEENRNPTFRLVANTGKPMMLNGFADPVVVDMQGARFKKAKTPIIADHDSKARIGHTTDQVILTAGQSKSMADGTVVNGPLILASGVVSSKSDTAKSFVADAKDGFPFEVSIGATITRAAFIKEGEQVTVNGSTFSGPLIVAQASLTRELSVLTLGADSDTSVSLAAAQQLGELEIYSMTFKEFVASLGFKFDDLTDDQKTKLEAQWKLQASDPPANPPANPPADPPANPPADPPEGDPPANPHAVEAAEAARQLQRRTTINRVAAQFSEHFGDDDRIRHGQNDLSYQDFHAAAIGDIEMSGDAFELAIMRAAQPQSGPAIHSGQMVDSFSDDVLACAALKTLRKSHPEIKANETHKATGEKWGIEHWYNEEVLTASDHQDLKDVSLHQILDYALMATGKGPYRGNKKSHEFIQAVRGAMLDLRAASGVTTLDVSQIFEDLANKMMWAGWQGQNTTWQQWARTESVSDFKTHNFYRLTHHRAYMPVGPDGELKHGGWTDQKFSVAAETYGKIVGMTRHHLINDDMNAFAGMMTFLGIEGAKTVEELAYVHLLSNLANLFGAGDPLNNQIDNDLTILGLTNAAELFENQVDADNAPIGIEPSQLLVGTQDRVQSGHLFNDTVIDEGRGGTRTDAQFKNNPHVSAFPPIVTPYLNNANIKQRVRNYGADIPNQDSDQWFMLPSAQMAQGAIVMVAFLNGNQRPFLEQADSSFETLGLQWRAYHDVGTANGETKLGLRSTGTVADPA